MPLCSNIQIPMLNYSHDADVGVTVPKGLKCTEMRMVRWMCGAPLNVRPRGLRITYDVLRERMDLERISVVMWRGRQRWFRHVEMMEDGNCVKRVRIMNVEGVSE